MSDYNPYDDQNSNNSYSSSYAGSRNNPYDNAQNYGNPYQEGNPYSYQSGYGEAERSTNKVLTRAFAYMVAALLITAVTAYGVSTSEAAIWRIYSSSTFLLLCGAELLVVVLTSHWMAKDKLIGSALGFLAYSVLNGVTLSYIFIIYDMGTVMHAFIIAAVVFGLMAVYGMITTKNLASWGSIGMMVLIGAVVTSLLNLFVFRSTTMEWVISAVILIVFVGITAWDVQKLKKSEEFYGSHSGRSLAVLGLYGAMELYLDFINIFIRLLSIFGNSRD